jgi:transposase-like protein
MPERYAREFRLAVCERLVAGDNVISLSEELQISQATLFRWKRQALVNADLAEGVKSYEADDLAQAHRTIAELEAELEAVKGASALFNGEEPASAKGGARLPRA